MVLLLEQDSWLGYANSTDEAQLSELLLRGPISDRIKGLPPDQVEAQEWKEEVLRGIVANNVKVLPLLFLLEDHHCP